MRDQLLVPEEKPCGTHIRLKDDRVIILSWSEYSPKTKQGKATETTWEFDDAAQKVILRGIALFSGDTWETGFANPMQYIPSTHLRKAREVGRERYHKRRFRGLVIPEPDRLEGQDLAGEGVEPQRVTETDEELFLWIQQLGSGVEAEWRHAQATLLNMGQATVGPLIAAYPSVANEQAKGRIVNILPIIAGDAVEVLIKQLVEGDPVKQECAQRVLPRIATSLPHLLELSKTQPHLKQTVQTILHELATNLGYQSLELLIKEYISLTKQADLPTATQLSYELRVNRMLESLEEAQECFASDLFSQTILTCDWVIQQLLMAVLEFSHLNLENDANNLRIVLPALREIGVRFRSEKDIRWLRALRNDLRYKIKRPRKREAKRALQVARRFTQEAKGILGLRL